MTFNFVLQDKSKVISSLVVQDSSTMSYARLIAELFKRSGKQVSEYAAEIDLSTSHLSNIINGKQPGSRKILEDCLSLHGLRLWDLQLPVPDPETGDELELVKMFRYISAEHRAQVLGHLKALTDLKSLSDKLKNKKTRRSA